MNDAIQFGGLTIELQRSGMTLTGRVHFPDLFHRDPFAIDLTVRPAGGPAQSTPGSLPDDELFSAEVILGKLSKVVRSFRLGSPQRPRLNLPPQRSIHPAVTALKVGY